MLIRVGIDETFCKWHAPFRDDGTFCYVPIPEQKRFRPRMKTTYDDFQLYADRFGVGWPASLTEHCHRDPDFGHVTYGDRGNKASRIKSTLKEGDYLVFYASFQNIDRPPRPRSLTYAVIGIIQIDRIQLARTIESRDWHRNAHTRSVPTETDVVFFGNPKTSGRLHKHLPIGEFRDGAYRVQKDLLARWGGLSCKDGYLQRSARPPIANEPAEFLAWLESNRPRLIHANNA